jgi:hypothetical protein
MKYKYSFQSMFISQWHGREYYQTRLWRILRSVVYPVQWIRLVMIDDMLWNDDEEDGDVRKCDEDEGTECEDGDSDTDW